MGLERETKKVKAKPKGENRGDLELLSSGPAFCLVVEKGTPKVQVEHRSRFGGGPTKTTCEDLGFAPFTVGAPGCQD